MRRVRSRGRFVVERDGYGPDWSQCRIAAMVQDEGKCQKCGSGRRVHVHHKRKIAWFLDHETGQINYETANDPSNLVVLCDRCHTAADGHVPLKGFRMLR